ncbi:hypothetical protein Lal_00033454 [Lupinus albus]|nr:hypothetical protein Lal_00033454 [Lupinus albus]
MLVKEAENWWEFTQRPMEAEEQAITWEAFKGKFLHKYFPADLKRKKEIKFLRLEQGNMIVGEYAAKYEELARYCPYYELEVDGRSKCAKFVSGLKPKLKMMMYEDDMKEEEVATSKSIPPKNFGPQRNFMHRKGKGKSFQEERKLYSPLSRPDFRLEERRTRFLPLPIDLESPLRFLRDSELGSRLRIGEGISTPFARIKTRRHWSYTSFPFSENLETTRAITLL